MFRGGATSSLAAWSQATLVKRHRSCTRSPLPKMYGPSSPLRAGHSSNGTNARPLKASPLAQWLHSYFSTHAQPFPVSVRFLHEKSGSPTKLLKHFKTELKNAFASLEDKLEWQFTWEKDLVTLKRPATPSQTRHLARKVAKSKQVKRMPPVTIKSGRRDADELMSLGGLLTNLLGAQAPKK